MQPPRSTESRSTQHATRTRLSRRTFLRSTAITSSAFMVVPSHVLGLNGKTPPSQKLNIAGIGIGGQGASDLEQLSSENIVALCDVDAAHAGRIFKKYPKAKVFTDFRKMLDEQKDIDAVMVATPDHLHAFVSMAAIKLGKHVYCEKPLTHSVWEARQLAQAAREHKVATQMGNQGQASEDTRRLCEFILDNAIGPVREVHVWTDRPSNGLFNEYWPQGIDRPRDCPPVPPTLDWDLWLGPAPSRPYHPAYLPFKWRGWWDFGTGALGDIGCHAMDPIFRALKLGAPLPIGWGDSQGEAHYPISVQASSSRVNTETYPLASMVTYEFAARGEIPALKLIWYDGNLRPPRPPELEDDQEMGDNGHLIIGDNGKILSHRGQGRRGFQLIPQKRAKEYGDPPKKLTRSIGEPIPKSRAQEYGDPPKKLPRSIGHHKEWIEACKGGQPAGSNFDWAGPLTEVVLLGNVALRPEMREELTMKKLLWNGPKMRFTNCDDANKFLRTEYREGWTL